MKLNLHLSFDGRCEAAFRFYEACLGGKIAFILKWGDSPMASHAPPEWAGKVCHATLTLGENILMGADPAPGNYVKPGGFHILIAIGDVSEAERIFAALSENGSVQTPLQKTFWAERFGVLTDQFGVPWEVNCEKPAS